MEAPGAAIGAGSARYEILARLATGGMAELFLARAMSPSGAMRHVVVKRILPARSNDPQFVSMFLDEIRLASQLHHPNIAQVIDVGRLGTSYFFAMEYIHGENARSLLQRVHGLRRQVPVGHAVTIAAGAAAGLHHAHDQTDAEGKPLAIVHRDVSPANILVSFSGEVKLVDFGVAKATVRTSHTRAGTIKGKIAYLSPEQCTGARPVDRRSDVFSLGIVMYELLTVTRLFRRESDFATMSAIVADDVPPPSTLRPDVPPALDRVILKALAKRPEDRYASAGAMEAALEEAAVSAGVPLSVGALGRYLRELFGERPEPWIELESMEHLPPPITVTGESIISLHDQAGLQAVASAAGTPGPVATTDQDVDAALGRAVRISGQPGAVSDDEEFLVTAREAVLRESAHDLAERPTVIDTSGALTPDDMDDQTVLVGAIEVHTELTADETLDGDPTFDMPGTPAPPPLPIGAQGPPPMPQGPPPMPQGPPAMPPPLPAGALGTPMPPVLPGATPAPGPAPAADPMVVLPPPTGEVPTPMPALSRPVAWHPGDQGAISSVPEELEPPLLTLRVRLILITIGLIVLALIVRAAIYTEPISKSPFIAHPHDAAPGDAR